MIIKKIKIAESENVCPNCGCGSNHELVSETALECTFYRVVKCSLCNHNFANAYLLTYDEDRPEDEMEIEL
jgi:formate dehydrogenase maturation protein FdhE